MEVEEAKEQQEFYTTLIDNALQTMTEGTDPVGSLRRSRRRRRSGSATEEEARTSRADVEGDAGTDSEYSESASDEMDSSVGSLIDAVVASQGDAINCWKRTAKKRQAQLGFGSGRRQQQPHRGSARPSRRRPASMFKR